MNNRIKALRQFTRLSQDAFGSQLGITGAAVSRIESGDRGVTDQVILAAVRAFGVSETWLRTGEGPMIQPQSRDEEIADFMSSMLTSPPDFRHRLISVLSKLSIEEWKLLETVADKLVEEQKKEADRD